MGKKSDERERRKAEKQQKFEADKASFVARVEQEGPPRLAPGAPTGSAAPRFAPARTGATKTPREAGGGSRFSSKVTWCITRADREGAWSWGEPRAWTEDEWTGVITPKFDKYVQMTWQEIDRATSDSGLRMHHGHELSDLVKEAQDRWVAHGLEEYDSIFRFRLGNTLRAWGFIIQAHFHLVWWDRSHLIYPVDKK